MLGDDEHQPGTPRSGARKGSASRLRLSVGPGFTRDRGKGRRRPTSGPAGAPASAQPVGPPQGTARAALGGPAGAVWRSSADPPAARQDGAAPLLGRGGGPRRAYRLRDHGSHPDAVAHTSQVGTHLARCDAIGHRSALDPEPRGPGEPNQGRTLPLTVFEVRRFARKGLQIARSAGRSEGTNLRAGPIRLVVADHRRRRRSELFERRWSPPRRSGSRRRSARR
jgi:hypothetical protein